MTTATKPRPINATLIEIVKRTRKLDAADFETLLLEAVSNAGNITQTLGLLLREMRKPESRAKLVPEHSEYQGLEMGLTAACIRLEDLSGALQFDLNRLEADEEE